jgi:hypothetical protein
MTRLHEGRIEGANSVGVAGPFDLAAGAETQLGQDGAAWTDFTLPSRADEVDGVYTIEAWSFAIHGGGVDPGVELHLWPLPGGLVPPPGANPVAAAVVVSQTYAMPARELGAPGQNPGPFHLGTITVYNPGPGDVSVDITFTIKYTVDLYANISDPDSTSHYADASCFTNTPPGAPIISTSTFDVADTIDVFHFADPIWVQDDYSLPLRQVHVADYPTNDWGIHGFEPNWRVSSSSGSVTLEPYPLINTQSDTRGRGPYQALPASEWRADYDEGSFDGTRERYVFSDLAVPVSGDYKVHVELSGSFDCVINESNWKAIEIADDGSFSFGDGFDGDLIGFDPWTDPSQHLSLLSLFAFITDATDLGAHQFITQRAGMSGGTPYTITGQVGDGQVSDGDVRADVAPYVVVDGWKAGAFTTTGLPARGTFTPETDYAVHEAYSGPAWFSGPYPFTSYIDPTVTLLASRAYKFVVGFLPPPSCKFGATVDLHWTVTLTPIFKTSEVCTGGGTFSPPTVSGAAPTPPSTSQFQP